MPEIEKPGPGWRKNEGKQPRGTRGKRVAVVLRNGMMKKDPVSAAVAGGWAADGKSGCNWSLRGDWPFDIIWFLVL